MKSLFTGIILFFSLQLFAQQNIADVRGLTGHEVTVSGIVTNGDELGKIRYFQDGTAGLAAYGDNTVGINRGDSITITGTLKQYNYLLELDPVESVIVHSSGNALPAPKKITVNDIGESYEGQLVQLNNVEFTNAGGTFAGNKNYQLTTDDGFGELRINSSSPIVGEIIPAESFNLVAIVSQFSRDNPRSGYQLLPRDMNDFISGNPVNFTAPVKPTEITKEGIIFSWNTDTESSTEIRYGTTPVKTSWQYKKSHDAITSEDGFSHQISVNGFEPATIIYAEAFSVAGKDTAFSSTGVYATKSNSAGTINVYFNTPVDHSVSTGPLAQNIGNAMEDTLIAYINRAEKTIDFSIYNINNSGLTSVSEALNNAHDRGVRIRFITDGSTNHYGTDDLKSEIPVFERAEIKNGGIMHNKFAIFDANSSNANQSWIWTGSTNLTFSQINTDANNSVFIQDQTLAKAYEIEFEEMWGSSGEQPNIGKAKFGEEKNDNTPHHFIIGGIPVECYFSPSDNTNQKIIEALKTAGNDLNVETMLITRSDIANTISEIHQGGTHVQVIIDEEYSNFESVNMLKNSLPAGKFIFDDVADGMLHHKIAIIDAFASDSDPQVITGSHNWSNSANDINDENTLIIHSPEIANIYFQQFAQRFRANGGSLYVSAPQIKTAAISVYPNPVLNHLNVVSETPVVKMELFTLTGQKVREENYTGINRFEVNFQNKNQGIYILKLFLQNGQQNTFKVIRQ